MTDTAVALEAAALGKRFGRRQGWALRDCSFRLPAGRVCAVVGPLTGLALRRTLPALAVAAAATAILQPAVGEARPHLWSWLTGTSAPPSSHFWSLQLTETAVVLALAAAATATAFRLLRRRTA